MSAQKKKLLLAGGSHADIPMIRAAKALGYHVTTSGARPTDLGHAHADEVRLADFSDKEAIRDLAERLQVEAIVASCNDFSALSCAWAAEQLGLPGHDPYDVACVLHHKDLYRAFAIEHGVPTPRAVGCASRDQARAEAGNLRFPVIVKPVDLTGGKGVSVARTPDDLDGSVGKALEMTRAGRIVIEEFLEGSRHGFTCILQGGRVVFHFQDNEHYFLNPYLVSAASVPARVPASAGTTLAAVSERVAGLLRLTDGIFHIQYILHEGEPVIIEICRRPPGDLYVELVRHATGVDYPQLIVRGACGLNLGEVRQVEPTGAYLRHCIMSHQTGVIRDLSIDPSVADKIVDQMLWWRPGDVIEDVMTHKLGIMFFRFDSPAEMEALSDRMPDLVRPVVA